MGRTQQSGLTQGRPAQGSGQTPRNADWQTLKAAARREGTARPEGALVVSKPHSFVGLTECKAALPAAPQEFRGPHSAQAVGMVFG